MAAPKQAELLVFIRINKWKGRLFIGKLLLFLFLSGCFFSKSAILAQTNAIIATSNYKTKKLTLLQPAPKPNKTRLWFVAGGSTATYTASMVMLNKTWYSQYPRTQFHWFKDWDGWMQIDKAGHAWTAYFEAEYLTNLYQWAGLSLPKAALLGGGTALVYQNGIELLDRTSVGWGASPGDIAANALGAAAHTIQALTWRQQRIRIKFFSHKLNYGHYGPAVQARALSLYGQSLPERVLKDYNGQTYWVSANLKSFAPRAKWLPKWLNLAAGYGVEGLLGAQKNSWETPQGQTINAPHIVRVRQFYLSPDIDLSRIKTRWRGVNIALNMLNIIKIPAPAISLNSKGKWQFYGLYW